MFHSFSWRLLQLHRILMDQVRLSLGRIDQGKLRILVVPRSLPSKGMGHRGVLPITFPEG